MKKYNICGKRVRQKREEAGLFQVDLAAAIEVDYKIKLNQSDISEIELGTRGVRDYELNALAEILEVDPTWLLRGKPFR